MEQEFAALKDHHREVYEEREMAKKMERAEQADQKRIVTKMFKLFRKRCLIVKRAGKWVRFKELRR